MKTNTFGYARVSTKEQNLDRQLVELKEFGIDERDIFTDKLSGKDFNRDEYQFLVNKRLAEGDLLVICSIDRLGRNYTEIQEQWRYITKDIKADIKVLDMPLLDTTRNKDGLDDNFVCDLVLQILSYVAEKERLNILHRQRQGIDCMPTDEKGKKYSKKTGRYTGRPKIDYPEDWVRIYTQWKNGNLTATKSMEILGLKRNTFYNLVKKYESHNCSKDL